MEKKLDLGYGNPGFLQELWDEHNLLTSLQSKNIMPYKYGKSIFPRLETIIKALHIKHQNAKISEKTQIVITVGAVQSLQAALFACKTLNHKNEVFIPAPFWGRFNDFLELASLSKSNEENAIKLITSPNNPNGMDQSHIQADIRDACYNWHHYTDCVKNFSDEIVVFSLSKLSGHSSTRIGWAVVQDPEKANYMKNHVNTFTSGVSVEAQINALLILEKLYSNDVFFESAAKILHQRFKEICDIIIAKKIPITVLSNQGMFLYINTSAKLIKSLNIICGESADYEDPNPNNFRLNLGVETETYTEFIARLANYKINNL